MKNTWNVTVEKSTRSRRERFLVQGSNVYVNFHEKLHFKRLFKRTHFDWFKKISFGSLLWTQIFIGVDFSAIVQTVLLWEFELNISSYFGSVNASRQKIIRYNILGQTSKENEAINSFSSYF